MIYKAFFRFKLDEEHIPKIEELLREKWAATDISLRKLRRGYWRLSFVTNDNRKLFAFRQIVENYGGRVINVRVKKEEKGNGP